MRAPRTVFSIESRVDRLRALAALPIPLTTYDSTVLLAFVAISEAVLWVLAAMYLVLGGPL